MAGYYRLTFEIEAEDEEALVAELWERGTLGLEARPGEAGEPLLLAWFRDTDELPPADTDWRRLGGRLRRIDRHAERDWLAPWRRHARPLAVGRSLLVDPREPDSRAPAAGGRRLLRLPARTAFGTGSHVSTQLAVELLEELPLAGRRLLDVGTGTGILAFAALHLGAAEVVALDVDSTAALQARQNAGLNRLAPRLLAGGVDALAPGVRFDVVIANVLPDRLAGDLPRLLRLLEAGGRAIFSGLVDEAAEELVARLRRHGMEPAWCRRREGWVGMVTRRSGR